MATAGWRRGDVPAWALALGIVVVCAVSLLLASFGAVGIIAVAVLLLAVIGLFRLFVGVDVPARSEQETPSEQETRSEQETPTDQPG